MNCGNDLSDLSQLSNGANDCLKRLPEHSSGHHDVLYRYVAGCRRKASTPPINHPQIIDDLHLSKKIDR